MKQQRLTIQHVLDNWNTRSCKTATRVMKQQRFNDVPCKILGKIEHKIPQPTTACYETATFTMQHVLDVTGTQEPAPTTVL
jgi:S-adenosylmethionine synthetase